MTNPLSTKQLESLTKLYDLNALAINPEEAEELELRKYIAPTGSQVSGESKLFYKITSKGKNYIEKCLELE